jgi:hypothetical protein
MVSSIPKNEIYAIASSIFIFTDKYDNRKNINPIRTFIKNKMIFTFEDIFNAFIII